VALRLVSAGGEVNSKSSNVRRRATRGLSLIELLVVIAIAAVLLGIGVPGMQSYVVSSRLAGSANDLFSALNFARSEAVRRQAQVTLAHNGTAGSRDWTSGWTMFVDANGNGSLDVGEEVLRVGAALDAPMTIFGSANFATFIAFDANGRLTNAGGGSFVICHGTALVADGQPRARAVLVNGAGRVRLAIDSNGDHIPETDTGPVPNCNNA
jgi:type IV fimbrial biogenesis protein FimT